MNQPREANTGMRRLLALLLNAGTALAMALGIAGLAWSMTTGAALDPAALRSFTPAAAPVLDRVLAGTIDAGTLMLASAIVLILTPILRVFAAMLLFGRERDWTYVFICLVVLAGLAVGAAGIIK
jgi:uncharacterized membrane protein